MSTICPSATRSAPARSGLFPAARAAHRRAVRGRHLHLHGREPRQHRHRACLLQRRRPRALPSPTMPASSASMWPRARIASSTAAAPTAARTASTCGRSSAAWSANARPRAAVRACSSPSPSTACSAIARSLKTAPASTPPPAMATRCTAASSAATSSASTCKRSRTSPSQTPSFLGNWNTGARFTHADGSACIGCTFTGELGVGHGPLLAGSALSGQPLCRQRKHLAVSGAGLRRAPAGKRLPPGGRGAAPV